MLALNALVIAAGRGDNPSDVGGILIIVGIILAVAIAGFMAHLVIHKGFLRKRGTAPPEKEHPPGRVGRL